MKKTARIFLWIMLIALSVSGCAVKDSIDDSDTYIFGQDSQETFMRYQYFQRVAESEDAYYFLSGENQFAYIIDKASHICRPLCNKSNCLHDKETSYAKKQECNAFLGATEGGLIFYKNHLYYKDYTEITDKDGVRHPTHEIQRLSLDGTKRDAVYSTSEGVIWDFKIHRGYIYFTATMYEGDNFSASGENQSLYRISVDGKGEPEEVIPLYEYENTNIMDTRYYGNHIFLYIDHFTGDEENTDQYLLRYDIETGEQTNISKNLKTNTGSLFTIFNGKIVFANKHKIYSCDLNGENEQEILDCDEILPGFEYYTPLTNDGVHIIVSPGDNDRQSDELIIIDSEGKAEVKKMPFAFSAYMGCNEDTFIVFKNNTDEEKQTVYIINKNDFSAEEAYVFE